MVNYRGWKDDLLDEWQMQSYSERWGIFLWIWRQAGGNVETLKKLIKK